MPYMMGKEPLTRDKLIEELKNVRGSIMAAARNLKVGRSTIYHFIKDDEEIRKLIMDEREGALDDVEEALYHKAMNGDASCIIFFLKTRGRHRGYNDLSPVFGAGGQVDIIAAADPEEKKKYENVRRVALITADEAGTIYDVLARAGALPAQPDGATVDGVYTAVTDADAGSVSDRPAS